MLKGEELMAKFISFSLSDLLLHNQKRFVARESFFHIIQNKIHNPDGVATSSSIHFTALYKQQKHRGLPALVRIRNMKGS